MKYKLKKNDWWKWGKKEKRKSLTDYPKLMSHLEGLWGVSLHEKQDAIEEITLNIQSDHSARLTDLFSKFEISIDLEIRLSKSLGKSYKDLLIAVHEKNVFVFDAVVFAQSNVEVDEILKIADQEDIIIIPFGGGSNVVSDFEQAASEKRPKVVLDLSKLNKTVKIDVKNQLATFQTGIYGPELESELNRQGMSLGHFPQSFEYSTLGGWIVTRSAGQESSAYGRIEDQVVSLKASTPQGPLSTSAYEGDAAGINLKSIFFGSEGSLGVVTEATLKIHAIAETKTWVVGVFPCFQDGLNALQHITQLGLTPSVVRFSDEHETFFLSLLSASKEGALGRITDLIKKTAFRIKNIYEPSIMMIRFDSNSSLDDERPSLAKEIFQDNGALLLGQGLGKKWERSRFGLPYLRDDLVERHIVVDTMETVFEWGKIDQFRLKLRKLLYQNQAFQGNRGILLTHVSHVYSSCASMYFTVLTTMSRDNPMKQWLDIKTTVTEAIASEGGAISHHHGVGRDHQPWLLRTTDALTKNIVKNVKHVVDPKNILNPGKLFDESK